MHVGIDLGVVYGIQGDGCQWVGYIYELFVRFYRVFNLVVLLKLLISERLKRVYWFRDIKEEKRLNCTVIVQILLVQYNRQRFKILTEHYSPALKD